MNRLESEKARNIFKWFDLHYFPRWAGIKLESLCSVEASASMPIELRLCTSDRIVTGGIHVLIGNAAAVCLAMMRSDNFTPLAEISEMKFLKPITPDDKNIIAKAVFAGINCGHIAIRVEIKNLRGELKAKGIFKYAILNKPYNPR